MDTNGFWGVCYADMNNEISTRLKFEFENLSNEQIFSINSQLNNCKNELIGTTYKLDNLVIKCNKYAYRTIEFNKSCILSCAKFPTVPLDRKKEFLYKILCYFRKVTIFITF